MNQKQISELFDTFVPNISIHTKNILKEAELKGNSVIKDYLITTSDGKRYNVIFYSLDMILVVGENSESFSQKYEYLEEVAGNHSNKGRFIVALRS